MPIQGFAIEFNVPAPLGNTNASKENRLFGDALRRAIAQENGKRVRESVEQLLDKAAKGDLPSIQTLADRLDGKPPQAIDMKAELRRFAAELSDDELAEIVNARGSDKT